MTSNDQSRDKPSLLVTVGSTLFPKLTNTILSGPILEVLAGRISSLIIQLGSAPPPSDLRTILDDFDRSKGSYQGMKVEIMDYTTDFEGLVRSSDLVISHAGMYSRWWSSLKTDRQGPAQSSQRSELGSHYW